MEFRHFTHDDLDDAIRSVLMSVHADAYADGMTEFNERFPWFIDHWGGRPGWTCVVAYDDAQPVGFTYGAPSAPGREWWREHWTAPTDDTSTYAVSELMVRLKWRRRGIATALHSALIAQRPEALAVLLVNTTNPVVQNLYASWGYNKVGEQQPFADSPVYAVMVKELAEANAPTAS